MNIRRVYKLPQKDYVCSGPMAGLLTNGFGSYIALHDSFSYRGWYVLQPKKWRMQKIIESITPLDEGKCETLYNQLYGLRRQFASGAEDTFTPYQKILFYNTFQFTGRVRISFDHRESYEQSRLGRIYNIDITEDFVLVTFIQNDENGEEYKHYVGIKGIDNVELLQNWREEKYAVDAERNAANSYWIYDAFTCKPRHHVVFASAESKSEARTLADIAYFHFDDIVGNVHEQTHQKIPEFPSVENHELKAATQLASWSLNSLHQKYSFDHRIFTGILAGLPWFFQIWSRDELISLGGLIALAKQKHDTENGTSEQTLENIKFILERHLKAILPNGTLSNRYPKSELGSIDSFGWLAKRVVDFLKEAKDQKQVYSLLSLEDLISWYNALEKGLEQAKKHYGLQTEESGAMLFKNKFCETWMDTSYHDDGREGIRVEIQALFYAVYTAINHIGKIIHSSKRNHYKNEQKQFKKLFREQFLEPTFKGLLLDGRNSEGLADTSYRPNIFLAAYLAENLCTKKEWKQIFDVHLQKLFLPWGGISTIDKSSTLFQPLYTGENNKSYHRGDVWYFVNNIAAMALYEIDPQYYSKQIQKIIFASAKDITELGFSGHASEVSSAVVQEAQGCYAQAWSAATFVELMELMHPYDEYQ